MNHILENADKVQYGYIVGRLVQTLNNAKFIKPHKISVEAYKQLVKSTLEKLSEEEKEYTDKQSKRIKALEDAGKNLLEAMNQHSFFLNGYANGSASISECLSAAEDVDTAKTVLFNLLKE